MVEHAHPNMNRIALKAGAMPRRIVAAVAVLAVLLVGGCSQVAGPTNPPPAPGAVVMITVPNVVGMTQAKATATIEAAGLTVFVRNKADRAHVGKVVAQPTDVGSALPPGSAVDIVVGYDPSFVIVPDAIGRVRRDAEARLLAAGLKFAEHVATGAPSSATTASAGEVFHQSPEAGSLAKRGSVVKLTFLGHK
jgi:serine/threonine-protein kinase